MMKLSTGSFVMNGMESSHRPVAVFGHSKQSRRSPLWAVLGPCYKSEFNNVKEQNRGSLGTVLYGVDLQVGKHHNIVSAEQFPNVWSAITSETTAEVIDDELIKQAPAFHTDIPLFRYRRIAVRLGWMESREGHEA